jgi:hypothetical protein
LFFVLKITVPDLSVVMIQNQAKEFVFFAHPAVNISEFED